MTLKDIINHIVNKLEEIPEIADVTAPPEKNEKITKYPTAVFYMTGSENSFDNVKQNLKTYKFEVVLLIGIENDTTENLLWNVLPTLTSAVEKKIDASWSVGTSDGARVWMWTDTGEDGVDTNTKEAYARLTINVRLLVNN